MSALQVSLNISRLIRVNMTETLKEKLKIKMEEKVSELTNLVHELKEAIKPQGLDNSVDRMSRMDCINNKSIDEASKII